MPVARSPLQQLSTPPHTWSGGGRGGTPRLASRLERWLCTEIDDDKSAAASRSNSCFLEVAPPLPAAGGTSLLVSCRHELATGARRELSTVCLVAQFGQYTMVNRCERGPSSTFPRGKVRAQFLLR